ncbi:MAG: potassium-transporting ATPase subunit KdpB [Candidatus Melainabacteria bacterium]|nr:potassium-transporting ATPase subunit KdpB [Candidatus Melainabacteria bacterium]
MTRDNDLALPRGDRASLAGSRATASSLFQTELLGKAMLESLRKLDPRQQLRNPVMFVVELGSLLTTALYILVCTGYVKESTPWFVLSISIWLWFTVIFSNFAEAMAEGRGKAQAASLRQARKDVAARKVLDNGAAAETGVVGCARFQTVEVSSSALAKGDVVLVEAGHVIPCDGEVVEGMASVDESAITGESAPVIRESGGDRSAVTGGTRVLSDWLLIKITSSPGETFLDRMISMVEGAKRQKTPNEIALNILLTTLTLVFLLVTFTLYPFSVFSVKLAQGGLSGAGAQPITLTVLVALLVCLIPTTIGGLLSAIGIAGMDRLIKANVIAMSGRAVEAAGDVDMLLLDKTGTITLGNRQAAAFLPAPGVSAEQLADAAQLASLSDETPEGRSIVILAKQKFELRERNLQELSAHFVPFSAQTRMSGADLEGRSIRKGAFDAIERHVLSLGAVMPEKVKEDADAVARQGGTPLVVADAGRVLGVVQLKDIVKGGIKERFAELRAMGIKTVMITGDNPLTAAAIAAEAGVDDYLAEATPEDKLALIREAQSGGRLVAMTGDGTNDAPALAQADVAVAMNTGTQAAKEACNMVDLDSSPTKLIAIVEIGKQLLMTRGSLTTFSIANDIAKYFAIIPAAFASTYPVLDKLNVMGLASPESAVLSAVIFNALIILFLLPLALRGVPYRPVGASVLLRDNLLVYGVGGVLAPFIGIKLIDMLLVVFHLV